MSTDGLISYGAEFSEDRVYRYRLWRRWDHGPMLMVIGLNPSTADESADDPTVRRCRGFARDWGYAGLMMMNLFAFRATDPREMLKAKYPVGPDNLRLIMSEARITAMYEEKGAILAAWGNHGKHHNESYTLKSLLSHARIPYACLGETKSGEPMHPLYLARDTRPRAYERDGGRLVTHWKNDNDAG